MTLTAVISDVHANSFALAAVLRDLRSRGAEEIYCLGDTVGYNAHPQETLRMLQNAAIPTIKGNHDMMACGELSSERCGPNARFSQQWTRQLLTEDELHYLRTLPLQHHNGDTLLLHSRLGDPVSYLRSDDDYLHEYAKIRDQLPGIRLCFTGHTHVARIVEITPDGRVRRLQQATATLDPASFYFINPGSVGHPRGSDYRASYALLERASGRVRLLRIHYDKAAMLAANHQVNIHTNLGPNVLEHELARFAQRLKRALM
ncbi:MAG TPA: metallophosphoesterase family protein [Gammaproteobacteria bacterium]|nr:metallophosphoesterase family protein [Gammaproteobacteria bacterium]